MENNIRKAKTNNKDNLKNRCPIHERKDIFLWHAKVEVEGETKVR
jgi:hypothetical protein